MTQIEKSPTFDIRYVEWNRCALNDYQNQANNGARITSMASKIVKGTVESSTPQFMPTRTFSPGRSNI